LHTKFDDYGFTIKHGAVFKMSPHRKAGCKYHPENMFTHNLRKIPNDRGSPVTDFRAPNEDNRSWNVVRSEADELMFRHAEECGAKVFDGVKVTSIQFDESGAATNGHSNGYTNGHTNGHSNGDSADITKGRPISAQWKAGTGETGTIKFDYVVDASGRAGILSTKYLKNRTYSQALKNVANWSYFSGCGVYGKGTDREGVPFFEALRGKYSFVSKSLFVLVILTSYPDESGWAWFIPLHNGTHSIGFVRNQEFFNKLKAENKGKPAQQHYEEALELVRLPLPKSVIAFAIIYSEARSDLLTII
jgi:flavine halogenase